MGASLVVAAFVEAGAYEPIPFAPLAVATSADQVCIFVSIIISALGWCVVNWSCIQPTIRLRVARKEFTGTIHCPSRTLLVPVCPCRMEHVIR